MRNLFLVCVGLMCSPLANAQTCNQAITATAPTSRYTLFTNGTALDKQTGLIWMRCAEGQTWDGKTCQGVADTLGWQVALQYAESVVFAGKSDWRLPNIKELKSLRELRCYPAINLTVFPNTADSLDSLFWSSSPYAYVGGGPLAWVVGFNNSDLHGEFLIGDGGGLVRLVRGGQ